MSRPRTLRLRAPHRPPKRRCIHGHLLAKVGFTTYRTRDGYTLRRCRACLLRSVQRCKRRKARRRI